MVTVFRAETPEHLDHFRNLVREFAGWAMNEFAPKRTRAPRVFASLEDELANLPGKYARPEGTLLLASIDDRVVGCIAGFRNDPFSMEMTRLWVRPGNRGNRVGEALVQEFLADARSSGYQMAVLRSHKALAAAHKIYRDAGFQEMGDTSQFSGFGEVEIAMKLDLK